MLHPQGTALAPLLLPLKTTQKANGSLYGQEVIK